MGFFDLLTPLLSWFDTTALGWLGYIGRLIVWAAAGSAFSMFIYAHVSPQKRLREIKQRVAQARETVLGSDDEWDVVWPHLRQLIGLSVRHVGLTLTPAIVASLPILFLIAWISTDYGFKMPEPGSAVEFTAYTEAQGSAGEGAGDGMTLKTWVQTWPDSGDVLLLQDPDGEISVSLQVDAPVPVIHKREWWSVLFGNPLGYLPGDVDADVIEFKLEPLLFVEGVPSWLSGWEAVFFTAVLIISLTLKFTLRIQ